MKIWRKAVELLVHWIWDCELDLEMDKAYPPGWDRIGPTERISEGDDTIFRVGRCWICTAEHCCVCEPAGESKTSNVLN